MCAYTYEEFTEKYDGGVTIAMDMAERNYGFALELFEELFFFVDRHLYAVPPKELRWFSGKLNMTKVYCESIREKYRSGVVPTRRKRTTTEVEI